MMFGPRTRNSGAAALLFMAVWCLAACGVKKPPLPPGTLVPPSVTDLRYQIRENRVTLWWSVPAMRGISAHDIAGAGVYRSKRTAGDSACSECPMLFSLIRRISVDSEEMNFSETLQQGYHYAYKVVLFDPSEREGAPSNIVQFSYE